jgi:hypothetical protein
MRSTAASKVDNETPRFLVKSDSTFLRTESCYLWTPNLWTPRHTAARVWEIEKMDNDEWIRIPSQKFRSNTRLENSCFIRCNQFAAPVFFFLCFWVSLSLEDAVAQLQATYRILETIQDCTNRRSPIQWPTSSHGHRLSIGSRLQSCTESGAKDGGNNTYTVRIPSYPSVLTN